MLYPLLFILFLLILWKIISMNWEQNPLDKLPGPPRYPIIGNLIELLRMSPQDFFHRMSGYTKLYGDRYIIKILRWRILHISNPQDMEAMLSHSKNINKSFPYSFFQEWLGSGLLLSTGSKWHSRRKILTPTFHFNILKNFSTVFEEKSRNLVRQLKAANGAEVNLLPAISDFTLFTICETAMGTQLDSDKSAETVEYKNAIGYLGYVLLKRLIRVWLHSEFVFKVLPIGRQYKKSLKCALSFAEKVINERKNQWIQSDKKNISAALDYETGSKKRLAMLDLLLEAESKGEIDLEGIRDEVNTFMFEGHDTTALAITYCIMLLADHKDVQDLVYEECQQIFGDSARSVNMSDYTAMKYLEAVIKETLRMYPSVPIIGREITEDFMMRDILVKKGSAVDIHIYDLHHRQDLFPEPKIFKPERFLEGDQRYTFAYIPFSAGLRNCIGQRFAILEMKCVLSEICRNFRLELRTPGWRPAITSDVLLRPIEPVYVKFLPR